MYKLSTVSIAYKYPIGLYKTHLCLSWVKQYEPISPINTAQVISQIQLKTNPYSLELLYYYLFLIYVRSYFISDSVELFEEYP